MVDSSKRPKGGDAWNAKLNDPDKAETNEQKQKKEAKEMMTRLSQKMFEQIRIAVAASMFAGSAVVQADESGKIMALTERVVKLEQAVESLRQMNESQAKTIIKQREELALMIKSKQDGTAKSAQSVQAMTGLDERLKIGGVVEVEASYNRTDSDACGTSDSDIALATVEIGVDADIADWIQAGAVLLWEEDDTEPLDIDVATVRLGNLDKFPLYFEFGKLYVPFGSFGSSFITDPVTLELGETRETGAVFGWRLGLFDLQLALYNGDAEEGNDTDDHIESFVVSGEFEYGWDDGSLRLGAAYTNNLADSDGLQDAVADNARGGSLNDCVGGIAAWASLDVGRLSLLAECIVALDDFEAGSLSFDGAGNDWAVSAEPQALSVEAVYNFTGRFAMGARYEHTSDAHDWLPENRYGINASCVLNESEFGATSLALEYLRGRYDDADGTSEDSVALQLSTEF